MAGREFCREEYQVLRQEYPSLALELVVAGGGILELGGKKITLQTGMIFSYGPRVPHAIRSEQGNRLVKYFVDFVGLEGEQLLEAAKMNGGKVAMIRDVEPLVAVFDLLINRGDRVSKNNVDLCTDYLRAILRMCSETLPLSSRKIQKDNCYNRAVTLIDQEYASLKTLEEVAGRLGVSPAHLSRSFRAMGEPPPSQRLARKKMTHAAGLLLSGEWKVKQAAYHLGYATPFHFSSVFKRHFGYSPHALHKQMRGGVTVRASRRQKKIKIKN